MDAISQNENNVDLTIISMLGNDSIQSGFEKNDIEAGEFSNIVNTISSNVEKTQSDFVEDAIKSNTSSINKFMLQDTAENEDFDFIQKSSQNTLDDLNFISKESEFIENPITNTSKDETDITLDSSAQSSAPIMPSPSFYSGENAQYSIPPVYADLSESKDFDFENIFKVTNKTIDAYFESSQNNTEVTEIFPKTDYIEPVSIAQEFENISGKTKEQDLFKFDYASDKSITEAFKKADNTSFSTQAQNAIDLEGFEMLDNNEVYEGEFDFKGDFKNDFKMTSLNSDNSENNSFDDSGFESFTKDDNQNWKQNWNNQKSSENINFKDLKVQNEESDAPKNVEDMKFDFVKKMKENLEGEIKTSSFSSNLDNSYTLSASDDVAKMSMTNDASLKINPNINTFNYGDEIITNNLSFNPKTEIFNDIFESNNILNQIGSKLEQLKDAQGYVNGQKLTLILRPNDLGRVSIQLTSDATGLTTNILAQNDEVRAYLERNIHILKQQLSDAGINVNSIQIKTHGQDGFSSYDGNQNLKDDDFNNQQNKQNNQENSHKNEQNEKEKQQMLFSMQDYDTGYEKDFSAILNKTTNYDL